MSTHTTAISLESFDGGGADSLAHESRSRLPSNRPAQSQLLSVAEMFSAAIVMPLLVLMFSVLILIFLSKLLLALVVTGFER
jgi:hypothetical protein